MKQPIPFVLRSLPAKRLLQLHQRYHGAARVVSARRKGRPLRLGSTRVATLECAGPEDACALLGRALEGLMEVEAQGQDRLDAVRTRLMGLVSRVQAADDQLARLMAQDAAGDRHTQALASAAMRDPLTGLLNRRAFQTLAVDAARSAALRDEEFTVLFLDLDHFKRINDTHGHAAGDSVLEAVASVLQAAVRRSDLVARWGGEEFVVLLPACPLEQGLSFAQRLRGQLREEEHALLPEDWRVTASIGVASGGACVDTPGEAIEALMEQADERAYAAKRGGRDRVVPDPDLGFSQVA